MRIAMVRSLLHKGSGQAVHITEIAKRLLRLGHRVISISREIEVKSEIPMCEFNFVGVFRA